MTQLFNISIDGILVTQRVSGCSVSEEVNRFYDVATFTIDNSTQTELEKDVIINHGSKTFNGFVYSVSKTGKNSSRVECRTNSAKLTEPYSPSESVFDNAVDSHSLCALYALNTGIPITNTSANLFFGGSYERNGTILSALSNIAAVTGSDFYNNDGTIIIEPSKAITTTGTVIPDSDIFDYIPDTRSVYNNGVGYITIQNGGSVTSDIVSNNGIYVEIDECSGELTVFTNPYGPIEHSTNISPLSATVIEKKKDFSVLDEDVITLDGAIESISAVTLNGVFITNYNFEQWHNVIYFSTNQRGTLSVTYKAYAYKGYANIEVTPLGRFISFDMFYLDQALSFQGFLSPDCINSSTDGDMTCITPKEMMYPKGFTVWTIGGVPEFTFYANNIKIDREVIHTSQNYISVEDATLEETLTGYRYKTRYPITLALGLRSAGVDVAYTTSSDADGYYFNVTQYYPKVSVSYSTSAISHYVQFTDIPNTLVTMVIRNTNTDEVCEHEIGGIDRSNLSTLPCVLGQNVPVNIAQQLGVDVVSVYGIVLSWLRPNLTNASGMVDVFGYLDIYADIDGDYVINTASIKPRTTITLTANVNG